MSKLSELLPAGASGKTIEAVATANIASKAPVILNSAGTVTQVAEAASSGGSEVVYESASVSYQTSSFDPKNVNTFIVAYRDSGNSQYGTVAVGTVSGSTVSFGTPVVFGSFDTRFISSSFDPNTANQFVLAYKNQDDTQRIYCIRGAVSGTSASFGTGALVDSGNYSGYPAVAFNPNTANQFVVAYSDGNNSSHGTAAVGTVSGTSISFASAVVFNAASTSTKSLSFDPNTSTKFVVAYTDSGNSSYGTGIVGTLSGTTPSFGSEYVFSSTTVDDPTVSFDPSTAANFVVCWRDQTNSSDGMGIVGTVASTAISYGPKSTFSTGTVQASAMAFNPTVAGEFVVAYYDSVVGNGLFKAGQVSGTDITYGVVTTFNTGQSEQLSVAMVPNSSGKFVPCYADSANSSYGTAAVWTLGSTNSASFVGIADAAISSGAAGTIVVQGGTATGMSSLTTGGKYYVQGDGSLTSPDAPIAYAIAGATYDSVSFDVTQDSTITGMCFNDDGTKMYVCGESSDKVYQYSLSSAYDLSTASYDSVSLDVSGQLDPAPRSVVFNNDGSALYVCGPDQGVFQYTLSSSYDLSTASYSSKTFSVSSQELYPCGMIFNNNGASMYVVGSQNDTVYQYTLSTPFDVSTASYASKSMSVNSEQTSPTGLAFNSDGTKIFVIGESTPKINQYTLSSAYDISTGSYDSVSYTYTQGTVPRDIVFNSTGLKFFIPDSGPDDIYQYTVGGGATSSVNAGLAISTASLLLNGDT